MNTIASSTLADMAVQMLERTAMVLAEPAPENADPGEDLRYATIAFAGPSRGTLTVGATEGFLREVAAGLLGVEPEQVNVQAEGLDALKEMANMLGGSVVLALSGQTCEYSLGLPALALNPPQSAQSACTVAADGGVLRVLLDAKAA